MTQHFILYKPLISHKYLLKKGSQDLLLNRYSLNWNCESEKKYHKFFGILFKAFYEISNLNVQLQISFTPFIFTIYLYSLHAAHFCKSPSILTRIACICSNCVLVIFLASKLLYDYIFIVQSYMIYN